MRERIQRKGGSRTEYATKFISVINAVSGIKGDDGVAGAGKK